MPVDKKSKDRREATIPDELRARIVAFEEVVPTRVLADLESQRPGEVVQCAVFVCTSDKGQTPPFMEFWKGLRGSNKEVQGDLARALRAVIRFSLTPPDQRALSPLWHVWKATIVKEHTGFSQSLVSFGAGKGTQIRIFGLCPSGTGVLVILTGFYKTRNDLSTSDWKELGRMMEYLRIGS